MKRIILLLTLILIGMMVFVSAEKQIGVFANLNTNCIQFIDPMNHKVSHPKLKGELGNYFGPLLDVAITSDGRTAIVSNFWDGKIFFIDISKGFDEDPSLIGDGFISFFAEDIAITPDDKYALVTDGSFSPYVGVIDIASGTLAKLEYLGFKEAVAVAITPDGKLALFADNSFGAIHSYWIESDGSLTFKETQIILPFWPANIAISPDGKTVIVSEGDYSIAPVFLIDSQYNLCLKEFMPMPSPNGQTCVFSPDGSKAYYLSSSQEKGTLVHVLNVTGPGKVSASGTSIEVNPWRGIGYLYGVETLAIDPSGNYLFITNPSGDYGVTGVSIIDLTTNTQVDFLRAFGIPAGIAFATIK